jgi:chitin disaccharide deacetylase
MPERAGKQSLLIVTADDYGYAPGYNRGILETVRAGAVDAVSAMVQREWCEPATLLATGVEIGLHLELPGPEPHLQLQRFETVFGRRPGYLDGHHHCHARAAVAEDIARLAAELGLPLRSVDPRHRRLLRKLGVATPDRLIGRMRSSEPALPQMLARPLPLPRGVTEWMVHPGHPDPRSGSSYDTAREQDLDLVLRVNDNVARRARRATHGVALAGA